jgi:hypothetical protein
MAAEVHKALTAQGEDRIEMMIHTLQGSVTHDVRHVRSSNSSLLGPSPLLTPEVSMKSKALPSQHALQTSWDLAYTSLAKTDQVLSLEEDHLHLVTATQSPLAHAGTEIPDAQKQLAALQRVQGAMQRERIYRSLIRYWRTVHILLALLTIGLTIWHLMYAVLFLLALRMH